MTGTVANGPGEFKGPMRAPGPGGRTALAALPRGAISAVARAAHDEAPALGQSPRGSLALAALNAYRRKVGFAIEDGHQLAGLTHFDLLNHPAVYDQIRAWIER